MQWEEEIQSQTDELGHTEPIAHSETSGPPGLDGAQEHVNNEVTSKSKVAEEPALKTKQTTTNRRI